MALWNGIYSLVLICFISSANSDGILPEQSQYDVNLEIQPGPACTSKKLEGFCSALFPVLEYKECTLSTEICNRNISLRVSFSPEEELSLIKSSLKQFKSISGISILKYDVRDVNECLTNLHRCSQNGVCKNTIGSYECHCGFGFKDVLTDGTLCVARCNGRSCRNGATCVDAIDEVSKIKCECKPGFTGETCHQTEQGPSLAYWTIVFISVLTALAALIGLSLCIFTCYRLFYKTSHKNSDTSSLASYKPRGIPHFEYDRITDLGSINSRRNRGFAGTIDEELKKHNVLPILKNDGLKFDNRLTSTSRLSIPSEQGDPTPVLSPHIRTDRHAVSDIPQADYYG